MKIVFLLFVQHNTELGDDVLSLLVAVSACTGLFQPSPHSTDLNMSQPGTLMEASAAPEGGLCAICKQNPPSKAYNKS